MCRILEELGDTLANRRPDLPDANSPYALLEHCLGVMEYWGGHLIHGRETNRDRPAEFRASGPVGPLVRRAEQALVQLERDVRQSTARDSLRNQPDPAVLGPDAELTPSFVLVHVFEELAQHHGHMEITRDVLCRESGAGAE
ncbi:MAG: DUF664 domain-containing protein [Pseudonocardiaceae bacterium]|nr:DUF664 domain-containing protein [Pseudonocardiaceae bacterium]